MSDRAKIRARRVTGNDAQQQREVARAIKNAREMALLPYSQPGRDPARRARAASATTADRRWRTPGEPTAAAGTDRRRATPPATHLRDEAAPAEHRTVDEGVEDGLPTRSAEVEA